MTPPLVRLSHVRKTFSSFLAFDDLSLEIAQGERLALLGPSGTGKTTLLRLMAGLDVPDQGEIWISGVKVSGPRKIFVAPNHRGVSLVFQDLALWPHLTVAESLDFVLGSGAVPRAERREMIETTLARVRGSSLANRYPHQLSGGEQQRAALARAIVATPRLLLLDEPFSSLDQRLRADLRHEVALLQQSLEMTTITVTHDRADADALADRIVLMGQPE